MTEQEMAAVLWDKQFHAGAELGHEIQRVYRWWAQRQRMSCSVEDMQPLAVFNDALRLGFALGRQSAGEATGPDTGERRQMRVARYQQLRAMTRGELVRLAEEATAPNGQFGHRPALRHLDVHALAVRVLDRELPML